jgi:hypothetical protein
MKTRIEEVLSRILSRKYDAKIKIKFKESTDEQGRNNHRVSRDDIDARKRDKQTTKKNQSN